MQKEFNHNLRYLIWYRAKQEEMKKDNIFTIFRYSRNITVKEGKLEFKRRINVPLNEQINITDSVGFKVIRKGEVIKEFKPEVQTTKEPSSEKIIILFPSPIQWKCF